MAAELEARITASLQSMLDDKFRELTPRFDANEDVLEAEKAASAQAIVEAEKAAKSAEAAAAAAAAVAAELESRNSSEKERLKESHLKEMKQLNSELAELRQRLRDGQDKAARSAESIAASDFVALASAFARDAVSRLARSSSFALLSAARLASSSACVDTTSFLSRSISE